jgi:hypothetical protein
MVLGTSMLPGNQHLREGEDFIILLNTVDDEVYFPTSKTLHKKFKAAVLKHFNVELIGQA